MDQDFKGTRYRHCLVKLDKDLDNEVGEGIGGKKIIVDATYEKYKYLTTEGIVVSPAFINQREVVYTEYIGVPAPQQYCGHQFIMDNFKQVDDRFDKMPTLENMPPVLKQMIENTDDNAERDWHLQVRAKNSFVKKMQKESLYSKVNCAGFDLPKTYRYNLEPVKVLPGDKVYFHYLATDPIEDIWEEANEDQVKQLIEKIKPNTEKAFNKIKDNVQHQTKTRMVFRNFLYKDTDGKNVFQMEYSKIFCYERNGEMTMLHGNVAVRPMYDDGFEEIEIDGNVQLAKMESGIVIELRDKFAVQKGELLWVGEKLGIETRDIKQGDIVMFTESNEFKNRIKGEEVYIMEHRDIMAKYVDGNIVPVGPYCLININDFNYDAGGFHPSPKLDRESLASEGTVVGIGGMVEGVEVGSTVCYRAKGRKGGSYRYVEGGHEWEVTFNAGHKFESKEKRNGQILIRYEDILYRK